MTPLSRTSRTVLETLRDGPRSHDEVLRAVMAVVPPGPAYRMGESRRRSFQRRDGYPETDRQRGTRHSSVDHGARTYAREAVRGRIRHGQVERDGLTLKLTEKGRAVLGEIVGVG